MLNTGLVGTVGMRGSEWQGRGCGRITAACGQRNNFLQLWMVQNVLKKRTEHDIKWKKNVAGWLCVYIKLNCHFPSVHWGRLQIAVADIYSHYAKENLVFNALLVFFQLSFLQDNDGGMTAQLPSTITSFVQTGLRPGEEYTVNLVALRDQGRSQPVTATVITCMY